MSFNLMMQRNLEELLIAGASFELSANGRMHNDLVDLAKCAKRGEGHLTLTHVSKFLHQNLIEIARAGQGHVTLKD
jgi:hypothetical protein